MDGAGGEKTRRVAQNAGFLIYRHVDFILFLLVSSELGFRFSCISTTMSVVFLFSGCPSTVAIADWLARGVPVAPGHGGFRVSLLS